MLGAITLLLVFQLVGEAIVRSLDLMIPGPVVGMALLLLMLIVRKGADDDLRKTSNTLLQHLSLLFVPAGVGVMLHFERLAEEWLALLLAVLLSTVIALGASGLLLRALSRGRSGNEEQS